MDTDQQHFIMQIIPATNANNNNYEPPGIESYVIRRTFADFECLHHAIEGICTRNGIDSLHLPANNLCQQEMVQALGLYVNRLLLLSPDLTHRLPFEKFFGEWLQDLFESRFSYYYLF